MRKNTYTKFLKYFNTLSDIVLLDIVQELTGIKTSNYIHIIRNQEHIMLSDHWDKIEISEHGIIFHNLSCPSYSYQGAEMRRKFDRYFYIPKDISTHDTHTKEL